MRLRNLKPYKLNKAIIELDDERNQTIVGYEEIATIDADIQPAGGNLKVQQYGKEITKYHTVFCYPNELIVEGLYIEYEGKYHLVKPIQKWRHWVFDIEVTS